MLPGAALYLNGVDTASLGFALEDVAGAFDGLERSDVLLELPQGVGSYLSSVPGRVAPRTITLSGHLVKSTRATLDAAKHAIKALCGEGLVEIRLAGYDRVYRGRLTGLGVTNLGPALSSATSLAASLTLRFLCPDPFAYDRDASIVGFGSTPVAIPLGTAPSGGRSWWSAIITIAGAATTPTLTEYDAAGNTLRSMAFTFSPTASDFLEVDLGRGLVTRVQSGVRDNGFPYVTAGFAFPRLDPTDGDYAASLFPQLAVSSGTASVRYYRAYQ